MAVTLVTGARVVAKASAGGFEAQASSGPLEELSNGFF